MEKLIIKSDINGERLDKFVADNSDISRSYVANLCKEGLITCNGKKLSKSYKVSCGDEIFIEFPEPQELSVEAENIPLDIVYEDSDVIVVNKPQGLCVHPAPGNENGTLVNGLVYHCGDELSAINGVIRPGIVHRIDKDTSGLLIVAKNNESHLKLSQQLKERKAMRKYIALVNGNVKEDSGTVNKPIGRNPSDRKKMAVVIGGREAITHYNVLKRFGQYTLIECILETGRTHQIRVHLASIGHSIVGDALYGIKKEKFNLNGQLLHAKTIGFRHPNTDELLEFTSEIPDYFKKVLVRLQEM